jgi:hypothetical protein
MQSHEPLRICPRCGGTLAFRSRYPVLAEVLRAPARERRARERLRYTAAWVCERPDCDYAEDAAQSA